MAQPAILCVDDDNDDLQLLDDVIRAFRPAVHVVHAHDGFEALDYLHEAKRTGHLPQLIIMDVNMPRMDGRQAVEKIRKEAGLREIPIIVFSTASQKAEQAFFHQLEVLYVTKPHKFDLFQQEVGRMLAHFLP